MGGATADEAAEAAERRYAAITREPLLRRVPKLISFSSRYFSVALLSLAIGGCVG